MAGRQRHPRPGFWDRLDRRIFFEWQMVLAALAMLTFLLSYFATSTGLFRLNQVFYDVALSTSSHRPALSDIVIIAIDDGSLDEIGHWPWRRQVHARLLDRLHAARAVGMDIVFDAPDSYFPEDDARLARAISAQGRVVMPLVLDGLSARRPLPALAQAARALGYINIRPDSDGTVRSITLGQKLGTGQYIPHFVLALLEAGGAHRVLARLPPPATLAPRLIPYAGGPGHFTMYSYRAVLDGTVPETAFAGKYVLIGAWSTGLGDAFPTPLGTGGKGMSGVEILANALQATIQDTWIHTPTRLQTALLAMLPVLIACLLMRYLSPRRSFFATVSILAAIFAGDWLYMYLAHGWVAPSAGLIGTALSYPIWSWRSQEAALRQIDRELSKLQRERSPFREHALIRDADGGDQSLPGRVIKLHGAIDQVRHLRQFFADSLDATPDPTVIFDTDGVLRFASAAALAYAERLGDPRPADGASADEYLRNIVTAAGQRHRIALLLGQAGAKGPPDGAPILGLWHQGIEVKDGGSHDMLLKGLPIRRADGTSAGTILTLVDISPIRAAQRRREETLRFVSHDMRSPQNSILALLELQRNPRTALPEPELLARIDQYSRKTLRLVDGFVQLARAESMVLARRPLDLVDLLSEICDEYWALAHKRGSRVEFVHDEPEAPMEGDREMLGRALGNLVDNAIKYSPADSRVLCRLGTHSGYWVLTVQDHGRGMDRTQLATLFTPFVRLDEDHPDNPPGAGLGLAFVKAVITRHRGTIEADSQPGLGSTFTVRLPKAAAQHAAAPRQEA
ncbi:CHASE2 domain-containing protein [Candidimonas humi]|uniref:histidine kinase n=1 Tax=Candidimonas humi TaxID=683355 RepID=A0ABV8NZP0_9BURK|nr:CHASE2 domain-containing protein [Candidimonas humi]MBV6304181.1 CHASE2 domain-containing protein [Candidimonas humi]